MSLNKTDIDNALLCAASRKFGVVGSPDIKVTVTDGVPSAVIETGVHTTGKVTWDVALPKEK